MATTTAVQQAQQRTITRASTWTVGRVINRTLFWLLVVVIVFYTVFPFVWALISSIKPNAELFQTPVQYWPTAINTSFYRYVLDNGEFLRALRNSVMVSFASVLIALTLGSLCAYAMGRMQFRGKTPIMYLILSMTMFPQIAILGSLFQMIRSAGLFDRLPALIFAYMTFTLPFTVWVLTSFFKQMPGALEEAAYVDGATPFQTFYKVLLPLVGPGMVTTGLLAFISAWNEFLFALSFTQTVDKRTVNVAIFYFSGSSGSQFEVPWGQMMAATVVVTVPLVVLVLIFQRRILAGLTAGAVKG